MFKAQSHLYKHICSFMNSMALKCAIELGIPDIIHNHAHPITLPHLVSALHIPHSKTSCFRRLMRLLVYSGFFSIIKVQDLEEEEEGYILTPSSRLVLKDNPNPNLSPFLLTLLHPVLVTPWPFFGDWLRGNDLTAFETAHRLSFWDHGSNNPEFSNLFNEALASDSQMLSLVDHAKELKPVFEGLSSLVDVGAGTGLLARTISEVFPQLKCTVLDLPHVVANLQETTNLVYVGGDMFHSIPSADALPLKVFISLLCLNICVHLLCIMDKSSLINCLICLFFFLFSNPMSTMAFGTKSYYPIGSAFV